MCTVAVWGARAGNSPSRSCVSVYYFVVLFTECFILGKGERYAEHRKRAGRSDVDSFCG